MPESALTWVLAGGLALGMLATALVAVLGRSLAGAVLAAGMVGLLASAFYLLLGAPDVALTEAAIGSGLSTFIFFYALRRIRESGGGDNA